MQVKTQYTYKWQHCCFQPIKVSLYNYPFIFIHGRTPRTLSLSLTCLTCLQIRLLLKQSLWFNSHPGHFLTWERPLDTSSGISPGYLSATYSQLTTSSLYRYNMMADYAFFAQGSSQWEEASSSLWGHLNICPLLQQFHITSLTQLELFSLTGLKAWGDAEKYCCDIAFLLVSTEGEATEDRTYGLSMVWVNPYQARVPTIEEAVGELTTLTSSGPDWPVMHHSLGRGT